jgi:hypothetical protein
MKQLILLPCFILLFSLSVFGQDSLETNPIIYADFEIAPLVAGLNNIQVSTSLNYQVKNNLFTVRLLGLGNFDEVYYNPDYPNIRNTLYEPGLLYGKRYISRGHSLSFSAGIAAVHWVHTVIYKGQYTSTDNWYAGLPFEVNYIWFRAKKRRSRIYGIFPYGKPTGFGPGIGLKLSGDVSEHSFASFGVVFGLGWYRQY